MPGEQRRRSFSAGALHPTGRLGLLPRVIDSVHDPAAGTPVGAPADTPAPDLKRPRRQKPARSDHLRLDRIPPHSIEAEKGVLGCVLLSPREGVGACFEQFARGEEFFYDPRHQTIFATIVELCDQQAAVDPVTLGTRLQDKGVLETVGGYAYLNALLDAVPSAANLSYYLAIVREKYLLRRLISTCTRLAGEAYALVSIGLVWKSYGNWRSVAGLGCCAGRGRVLSAFEALDGPCANHMRMTWTIHRSLPSSTSLTPIVTIG